GWRIAGTARARDLADALAARDIDAHVFARGRPLADAPGLLTAASHVLISAPPDEAGDAVLDLHGEALAGADLAWLGYLSSTGVYGDRDGGWVDENTAPDPSSARARRRFEAERRWLALARDHGLPVHIFRLAGIYGPGRSMLDQLRAGGAHRIDKPGHVFSRIHVDDIVATLRASMARPHPGAVYNVCDDAPAPQREIIEYAARLLGIEPPPLVRFDEAALSPMARGFYADNRRVRNDRIKRELGVTLAYPDYKAGLAAIAAAN
ncbi:MAG: NAD-dependent epimerase/dehydratase family protein, partial [Alphaproteobacteria bacterium]